MKSTRSAPGVARVASASTPRYVLFDLLRGLAAIIVLVFHMNYMLGPYSPGIHKGYLAVDFFFILSGFVISANYHTSVRPDITWREFLVARIARLWPLFFLATLFGCVAIVSKLTRDAGFFDAAGVVRSLAVNVLMLPSFFQAYEVDRLFLFNGASWSVFFEMLVNLLFFAGLRGLRLRPLLFLCALFGGLLAWVAKVNGSLDGGWAAATFHVGSIRVLFGFTAGMAIFLVSRALVSSRWRYGSGVTMIVVAIFCYAFFVDGPWWVDVALVLVCFPVLVLVAATCDLGGAPARVGRFLGDVSYSVYLLQTPAMLFVAGAFKFLFGRKVAEFAPLSGVIFVFVLIAASYLSWRFFEVPARNFLRRRLASRRAGAYAVRGGLA